MREKGKRISGGNKRKVQVRKVRQGGFTAEKRQTFLDHLASCNNIVAAARAAGISVWTVNYHRRRDPVFAQDVAEAIEAAELMLHSLTLEKSAWGTRHEPGDTEVPGPETVDTELALRLLSMRGREIGRRTGDGGRRAKRATEKELKEAILHNLGLLAKRLRKKKGVSRRRVSTSSTLARDERVLQDGVSTGSTPARDERGGGEGDAGERDPRFRGGDGKFPGGEGKDRGGEEGGGAVE